jgi:hypothetical protein
MSKRERSAASTASLVLDLDRNKKNHLSPSVALLEESETIVLDSDKQDDDDVFENEASDNGEKKQAAAGNR